MKKWIFCLCFILVLASPVFGTTYYAHPDCDVNGQQVGSVDDNGCAGHTCVDSNPASQACSIDSAVSKAAATGGDIVSMVAGTYTLDGAGGGANGRINGFAATTSGTNTLQCASSTVDTCIILANGTPYAVFMNPNDNWLLKDFTITGDSGTPSTALLYIGSGTDYVTARHLKINGYSTNAINITTTATANTNITIERSFIDATNISGGSGVNINGSGVTNASTVIIQNNIIANTTTALLLKAVDGIDIVHNTIYKYDKSSAGIAAISFTTTASANPYILNNLFYSESTAANSNLYLHKFLTSLMGATYGISGNVWYVTDMANANAVRFNSKASFDGAMDWNNWFFNPGTISTSTWEPESTFKGFCYALKDDNSESWLLADYSAKIAAAAVDYDGTDRTGYGCFDPGAVQVSATSATAWMPTIDGSIIWVMGDSNANGQNASGSNVAELLNADADILSRGLSAAIQTGATPSTNQNKSLVGYPGGVVADSMFIADILAAGAVPPGTTFVAPTQIAKYWVLMVGVNDGDYTSDNILASYYKNFALKAKYYGAEAYIAPTYPRYENVDGNDCTAYAATNTQMATDRPQLIKDALAYDYFYIDWPKVIQDSASTIAGNGAADWDSNGNEFYLHGATGVNCNHIGVAGMAYLDDMIRNAILYGSSLHATAAGLVNYVFGNVALCTTISSVATASHDCTFSDEAGVSDLPCGYGFGAVSGADDVKLTVSVSDDDYTITVTDADISNAPAATGTINEFRCRAKYLDFVLSGLASTITNADSFTLNNVNFLTSGDKVKATMFDSETGRMISGRGAIIK